MASMFHKHFTQIRNELKAILEFSFMISSKALFAKRKTHYVQIFKGTFWNNYTTTINYLVVLKEFTTPSYTN